MTIWILRQAITPDEEAHVAGRVHLVLPFGEAPDLSGISDLAALRRLLQALHPEDPPETITRRAERIWPLYNGMAIEDIIAVPLPSRRELALAEVTGRYHYQVGAGGADVHLVPVKWHDKRVSYGALRRYPELLAPERPPMFEVGSPKARVLIRDRLPHCYNRFARWKWLLALFFAMGAVRLAMRLTGQ
ncbi:MAG: hypothetical protein KGJ21_00345 [Pseudomonadota bacterium]|nr:hypothetical protein [Pseudomonadota bacterium]